MKNTCLCLLLALMLTGLHVLQAQAAQRGNDDFIIAGENATLPFQTFMSCNGFKRACTVCESHENAAGYLYSPDTAAQLQSLHFILVPGGDYDFFNDLLGLCDGEKVDSLENLRQSRPWIAAEIEAVLLEDVCPDFAVNPDYSYNTFMGAFAAMIEFLDSEGIPAHRIDFLHEGQTHHVGSRLNKLNLIAGLIESLEADTGLSEPKHYVLIGHSRGGIGVLDFLVELQNAHTPEMPEGRAFRDAHVRGWPSVKKDDIFSRITAAVFINTFLQGDHSSETRLLKTAREQHLDDPDPVQYYIDEVLHKYAAGEMSEEFPKDTIIYNVLRSNRYRTHYYLQGKNSADLAAGSTVTEALDTIAERIATISIGCRLPRLLPDLRVGVNFLVHESKAKYRHERTMNDGLIDTWATLLPRDTNEHVIFHGMDHGTLILKPAVRGITTGHHYDQIPFVKTLLARIAARQRQPAQGLQATGIR